MRCRCGADVVPEHPVDAVTSKRMAEAVQKDGLIRSAVTDEVEQLVRCGWPEWAPACLASFSLQLHAPDLLGAHVEITDSDGCRLRDACAGVVQK